jgi:hypothetical protein
VIAIDRVTDRAAEELADRARDLLQSPALMGLGLLERAAVLSLAAGATQARSGALDDAMRPWRAAGERLGTRGSEQPKLRVAVRR